jgi:hypothetical protein
VNNFSPTLLPGNLSAGDCKFVYFPVELAIISQIFPTASLLELPGIVLNIQTQFLNEE